jgi:hypothetical protein
MKDFQIITTPTQMQIGQFVLMISEAPVEQLPTWVSV